MITNIFLEKHDLIIVFGYNLFKKKLVDIQ